MSEAILKTVMFRSSACRFFAFTKNFHLSSRRGCCDQKIPVQEFCHNSLVPRTLMLGSGGFELHHNSFMKLKQIQKELLLFQQFGCDLPYQLSDVDLMNIILLRTQEQRKAYYKLLRRVELRQVGESSKENFMNARVRASYTSSIIPQDVVARMDAFYVNNLVHALRFEQDLIIDLSYDDQMHREDMVLCVNLLRRMFIFNKRKREPFHFHLCSVANKPLMGMIKHRVGIGTDPALATLTSKSYLELFPHEKLVYLTPDAEDDLIYSHDDIYIVGGLVERRTKKKPRSLDKAESLGLRKAKLPIRSYQHPEYGQETSPVKILRLNEMMEIMHVMKESMDWNKAFQQIPEFRFNRKENLVAKKNFFVNLNFFKLFSESLKMFRYWLKLS